MARHRIATGGRFGSPDMLMADSDRIAAVRRLLAAGTVPSSADPQLTMQFDARMRRMFDLLDAALADPAGPTAIDDLRDALHKVAGTAAFFGKADLGTLAADLDERLGRDGGGATPVMLGAARAALRRVATGGH